MTQVHTFRTENPTSHLFLHPPISRFGNHTISKGEMGRGQGAIVWWRAMGSWHADKDSSPIYALTLSKGQEIC